MNQYKKIIVKRIGSQLAIQYYNYANCIMKAKHIVHSNERWEVGTWLPDKIDNNGVYKASSWSHRDL